MKRCEILRPRLALRLGRSPAEQATATVNRFEDLFPHGSVEEQKEFVGLFVYRVKLDLGNRVGDVYLKRLPMPAEDIGRTSGSLAGAGFEPATFGL